MVRLYGTFRAGSGPTRNITVRDLGSPAPLRVSGEVMLRRRAAVFSTNLVPAPAVVFLPGRMRFYARKKLGVLRVACSAAQLSASSESSPSVRRGSTNHSDRFLRIGPTSIAWFGQGPWGFPGITLQGRAPPKPS